MVIWNLVFELLWLKTGAFFCSAILSAYIPLTAIFGFWLVDGLATPAIENDFWISATDNFCPSAIIPLYFSIAWIDEFLSAYSISQTPVEFPLISLFNSILTISPNSRNIVLISSVLAFGWRLVIWIVEVCFLFGDVVNPATLFAVKRPLLDKRFWILDLSATDLLLPPTKRSCFHLPNCFWINIHNLFYDIFFFILLMV